MGKPTGFIEIKRRKQPTRPVAERLHDWREVYLPYRRAVLAGSGRALHGLRHPVLPSGLPARQPDPGLERPRLPRPLAGGDRPPARDQQLPGVHRPAVPGAVRGRLRARHQRRPGDDQVDRVGDHRSRFDEGWVTPPPPASRTGKTVAVVGSGPAGLAAAEQLNRAGHTVTVFERADRIGGLLRYGIPEFKMEKRVLDRRLRLMEAEGVVFQPGCDVGVVARRGDAEGVASTRSSSPAASPVGRDLPVPGRELDGIHFAMDYLTLQNRRCEGRRRHGRASSSRRRTSTSSSSAAATPAPTASAPRTARAPASVHQLELLPQPPAIRAADNPWPLWPNIFRVSSAHEEGGERLYSVVDAEVRRRRQGPRPRAGRPQRRDGQAKAAGWCSSRCRAPSSS